MYTGANLYGFMKINMFIANPLTFSDLFQFCIPSALHEVHIVIMRVHSRFYDMFSDSHLAKEIQVDISVW